MRCVDVGPHPLSDCVFHPTTKLFATCSVEGTLNVFEWDQEKFLSQENPLAQKIQLRDSQSSRTLRFNDQQTLACSNKSGGIKAFDVESGRLTFDRFCHHEESPGDQEQCAVNSLLWWNDDILISGCENGALRFWDLRMSEPLVATIKECDDQITAMDKNTGDFTLFVGSGEQLSVFDLRKTGRHRLMAMSDGLGSFITSLCVGDSNRRLWCGMEDGCIGEFNTGHYGYVKTRIQTNEKCDAVESMCKVADSYLIGGTTDGLMHVVSMNTSSIVRTFGETNICQEDNQERLAPNSIDILSLSGDQTVLAASQIGDSSVFFHKISDIIIEDGTTQPGVGNSSDFFQDL